MAELVRTSTPKVVGLVPVTAVITSQRLAVYADASGTDDRGRGTVTPGTTPGSFSIELEAHTGEVSSGDADEVPAGRTVQWVVPAVGTGTDRILRMTRHHPPPPAP